MNIDEEFHMEVAGYADCHSRAPLTGLRAGELRQAAGSAARPIQYNGQGQYLLEQGFGYCLVLFLGLIFPLAMQFIRNVDPKGENYNKFPGAYKMIRLTVAVICDAALVLSVSYGLDVQFPAGKWATVSIGLLLAVIGNFLPQIRDNYFTGVRTPWTLHNPAVWRRTHRFSGRMWVTGGLLIALAAFMPVTLSISMIITALVIMIILPIVYSWLISRRVKA